MTCITFGFTHCNQEEAYYASSQLLMMTDGLYSSQSRKSPTSMFISYPNSQFVALALYGSYKIYYRIDVTVDGTRSFFLFLFLLVL